MFTANEMKSFGGEADRVAAGQLYMRLKKEYKGRLDIDFYDPRCFVFLFDTLRYRLRGGEVTWVLDGKVIFRGIPSWEGLKSHVDSALMTQSAESHL